LQRTERFELAAQALNAMPRLIEPVALGLKGSGVEFV
jgi:hypothetical protein